MAQLFKPRVSPYIDLEKASGSALYTFDKQQRAVRLAATASDRLNMLVDLSSPGDQTTGRSELLAALTVVTPATDPAILASMIDEYRAVEFDGDELSAYAFTLPSLVWMRQRSIMDAARRSRPLHREVVGAIILHATVESSHVDELVEGYRALEVGALSPTNLEPAISLT